MANQKVGRQSFIPTNPPSLIAWASVAGKKESEGPLSRCFDIVKNDSYFGQKTWEQAEKKMQQLALQKLAEKANTLINSYRKFYPTKEEVFFKPELSPGSSFTVGGIINESVRCRD